MPERYGGPGDKRLERILQSLNRARGDSFDTSTSSNVYYENLALARAICMIWELNRQMASQWDPRRMTHMLPRWEKILGIVPNAEHTEVERRAVVLDKFQRWGESSDRQRIYDGLREILGATFYDVEYISYAAAVIHTPDGTYSFGTANTAYPWYSTVAHILIRLQVPSGYSNGDLQEKVAGIHPFMDSVCPAWVTWDWYVPPASPVAVSGGPSAGGFFLDEDFNLNRQVFD